MNEPQKAPINPKFKEEKDENDISIKNINNFGLISSPIDMSHYKKTKIPKEIEIKQTLPSSYDLRNENGVTSIKNQGQFGTCWAFGTCASPEGIKKRNFSEIKDFSEKNVVNKCGWIGVDETTGGYSSIVAAYCFGWRGLIKEEDDPYPSGSSWSNSPDGLLKDTIIKEYREIPNRENYFDNDEIKKHLINYGPVTISYAHDSSFFNYSTNSYYNDGSIIDVGGHCVCCIGWNDNYSKSNFNIDPGINGAFLIKNSWGTNWGDNGFFWISYADTSIDTSNTPNISIPYKYNPYIDIYQHDLNGWVGNVGYSNSDSWAGKIFQTKTNSDALRAITFITTNGNQEFDIYIYKNPNSNNPSSGTLAYNTSGIYEYVGYHTLELPYEISLDNCNSFSIVIRFKYSNYNYLLGCEYTMTMNSSAWVELSEIFPGQSFMGNSSNNWGDCYYFSKKYHVCIKALTGINIKTKTRPSVTIENNKKPICSNSQKGMVCESPF